jgi:hypothetical protein
MNRLDIVQTVIDYRQARTYVEIGVKKGKVFLHIKARKKLAVDPVLKISLKRKVRACLSYTFNFFNEYYNMTSDDFFKQHSERLLQLGGPDVVFIDGLHTYIQTWKDVLNSLKHLSSRGVILMHDCSPASADQAAPAESREHAAVMNAAPRADGWSGDVWKTIVRLRSERADLRVGVVDCDHGVGIIFRGAPEGQLHFTEQEIDRLGYNDLEKDRRRLLNLKNPHQLRTILGALDS